MPVEPSLIDRLPCEFAQSRRILIAFSGGLDSRVLLQLASEARGRLRVPVRAVHVDHGLQADSGQWARDCDTLCKTLGVPLDILKANLKPAKGRSVEAEARRCRYALFESILCDGDLLLLAQHADDQAETVLLQLLRGAGPAGLSAMARVRPLGDALMVRPLLGTSRAEIESYAQQKQLDFIEDPTNEKHRFDRNYLRHEIFPLLEQRFPGYRQTFARSAANCAENVQMLAGMIEDDLGACREKTNQALSLENLLKLPKTRQKAVIRAWIDANGFKMPQMRQLERMLKDLLNGASGSHGRVGNSDYEIRRFRKSLYVLPKCADPQPYHHAWRDLAKPLFIPELNQTLTNTNLQDWGIFLPDNATLLIASRTGGEKIRQGYPPRHRTLKNIFRECALPPWQRERIPLLFLEEQLIAVPGIAVDPDYARPGLHRGGEPAAT